MVGTDTVLLNRQLFEDIGVDVAEIDSLTLAQYLDFYQRAVALHGEETIYLNPWFTPMEFFMMEGVYDVERGTVYVNTPELRNHLELALNIPLSPLIEFTPEGLIAMWQGVSGGGTDPRFFCVCQKFLLLFYHLILWKR